MKRKTKLSLSSLELSKILINKMLEKHGVTFDEIVQYPNGEINGVDWYEYYTMTQQEYDDWREWSKNFIKQNVTPKLSNERIRQELAWFDLAYSIKVV
jgi:hypothetical protein